MDDRRDAKRVEQDRFAAAQAHWEYLAARARAIHCPVHGVAAWRIAVTGDTPEKLNLQIYGCCANLGHAVNDMVNSDPRVSGPT